MHRSQLPPEVAALLRRGTVIPAHPLALDVRRRLDERRQRALTRYYLDAGSGGLAVGVHATQFAIREAGLYERVLAIAAEEAGKRPVMKIAGLAGKTSAAKREAQLARELGYHAGMLSLGAMKGASIDALVRHCTAIAEEIPLIGFYLQTAVGGIPLPMEFWRRFAAIDNVVAIKIAPFDRYRTLEAVRGISESDRGSEVALYTGNDDAIMADLVTPLELPIGPHVVRREIVGGLLGQWAVWTKPAVQMLRRIHHAVRTDQAELGPLLVEGAQLTDANAAIFDAENNFAGCIAGVHEILRRQGLLAGTWCLDPRETLSPGQVAEIDRVCTAYPHLADDAFVAEHIDAWLR
jgi:hypothetical protein